MLANECILNLGCPVRLNRLLSPQTMRDGNRLGGALSTHMARTRCASGAGAVAGTNAAVAGMVNSGAKGR
jgi:hypothetical protein